MDENGAKDGGRALDSYIPYRDASLSVEERVEDLLARMTVAEKVGQMFHVTTHSSLE